MKALFSKGMILPGARKKSATMLRTAIISLLTNIGQTWTLPLTPSWRNLDWSLAGKRRTNLLWQAGSRAMNLRKPERWDSKNNVLTGKALACLYGANSNVTEAAQLGYNPSIPPRNARPKCRFRSFNAVVCLITPVSLL